MDIPSIETVIKRVERLERENRRWRWGGAFVLVVGLATIAGGAQRADERKVVDAGKASFDQITVQRINVVEPDGTLRMVISNHARLPGLIIRGKEQPFARPQAGMIFYNDEGSENGGLIFGGRRNAKGEVVDAGGSLSFDKYDANAVVQLAGVDDSTDRFAGLSITDNPTGKESRRRIWVGRDESGAATLALMDSNGKKRLLVEVTADGIPSLSFLDANGKILRQIRPADGD
jgi:hypothetical protein